MRCRRLGLLRREGIVQGARLTALCQYIVQRLRLRRAYSWLCGGGADRLLCGDGADVEDLQNELQRKNRSIRGLYIAVIVLILLLLPAGYFLVRYGKKIKTEFIRFLRDEIKFSTQDALLRQISQDVLAARCEN